jgi:hypothetical protein
LIDAIEDYDDDKKKGNFNFLLLYSKTEKTKLIEVVSNYIYECLSTIKSCIESLPISVDRQNVFIRNLLINVNAKISKNKCCYSLKHCAPRKIGIKERFQYAIIVSQKKSLTKKYLISRFSTFGFVSVSLILMFLLFPYTIYAVHDTIYKLDVSTHCSCCGTCCGFCCDGCFGDCCGRNGNGGECANGHVGTDCGNTMPCDGCCGCLCCLGCLGMISGGASEAPVVIVKVITAPAKECC